MGTTWTAKFLQPAASLDPVATSEKIAARLEVLEQQFSTYRQNSDLSRFNASASTDGIAAPPELVQLALEARRLSDFTDGAFDVTVAPLVCLWGFGPQGRGNTLPTESEITEARALVGWRQLEARTSPPALRKTAGGVSADFSSIAKGLASDLISELLAALGAPDHFVQIGGDVRTGGHAADGTAWRTGIEEPRENGGTIACVVALSGQALSTSGNYRNFVTLDGRRYGHILDPRTGRPAAGALAAVSVVHATCARSSALATALFVLGEDAGLAFATREKIAAVFFIHAGDSFTQHRTPEFEEFSSSRPR